MTQILCVVGARPNFMKIAPIMAAFAEQRIAAQLLHTGQHYDEAMNDRFFMDLGIPRPDHIWKSAQPAMQCKLLK